MRTFQVLNGRAQIPTAELTDEYTGETFLNDGQGFHKDFLKIGHIYRTKEGERFLIKDKDDISIIVEPLDTQNALASLNELDRVFNEILEEIKNNPKMLPIALATLRKAKLKVVEEYHKKLLEDEGVPSITLKEVEAYTKEIVLTGIEARSALRVPEYNPMSIVPSIVKESKRSKAINKLLSLFL